MFTAVLQAKEAELSVQRSAALAYQGWGETDDPKWFENAIQGSDKNRTHGKESNLGLAATGPGGRANFADQSAVSRHVLRGAPRSGPLPISGRGQGVATRRSSNSTSPSKASARCCRSIRIWAATHGAASLMNWSN